MPCFPYPGPRSDDARPIGRRRSGGAALCAALLLLGTPRNAAAVPPGHGTAPATLTVAVPDPVLADVVRAALLDPFERRSGVRVRSGIWDGRLSTLENQARDGTPPPATLLLMDDASVLAGCRQGLLLPLDPAAIPGLDAVPHPAALSRCGLGALRTGLVLAWDRSRMDGVPGWGDFWNVAQRPGKRGLARDPRGTLEIALLADGVAPGDVYRVLGTADGLDRAFRKLDQIKPYLVWWNTEAEAVQLIENGAVLMTSAPDEAVAAADQAGHRDFGVQWRGGLSTMLSWAMPGKPEPDGAAAEAGPDGGTARSDAERLLGFTLEPDRRAALLSRFPTRDAAEAAPATDAPPANGSGHEAGSGPDAVRTRHLDAALQQDDAFWAAHGSAIRARFELWIDG